jgi:hypothetical protein
MASYEVSDSDVTEVKEIIAGSELRSIDFYEVSARRYDAATADETCSDEGTMNVEVQYRSDDDGCFGVRLRGTLNLPRGQAEAIVAGEYDMPADLHPRGRALQLFVNEVAVMTLYPYLREGIASITSKVFEKPFHLPLIERGELGLEVDDN